MIRSLLQQLRSAGESRRPIAPWQAVAAAALTGFGLYVLHRYVADAAEELADLGSMAYRHQQNLAALQRKGQDPAAPFDAEEAFGGHDPTDYSLAAAEQDLADELAADPL